MDFLGISADKRRVAVKQLSKQGGQRDQWNRYVKQKRQYCHVDKWKQLQVFSQRGRYRKSCVSSGERHSFFRNDCRGIGSSSGTLGGRRTLSQEQPIFLFIGVFIVDARETFFVKKWQVSDCFGNMARCSLFNIKLPRAQPNENQENIISKLKAVNLWRKKNWSILER